MNKTLNLLLALFVALFLGIEFYALKNETMAICIISIISLIFYGIGNNLFHEMGHGILCKFFDKEASVKIVLRRKGKTPKTFVSNNFLGYTKKEIQLISMAGYFFEFLGCICLGVIVSLLFRTIFPLIALLDFYGIVITFKLSESIKNSTYSDIKILLDPMGFLDYMKNSQKDSSELYENVNEYHIGF